MGLATQLRTFFDPDLRQYDEVCFSVRLGFSSF
ncbi:MAG: hypothetical protein EBZ93_06810 [Actinobacteria bacterium]|nr:hypothetical protein [Actinomycetota bacterium]